MNLTDKPKAGAELAHSKRATAELITVCLCGNTLLHKPRHGKQSVKCPCGKLARGKCGLLFDSLANLALELVGRYTTMSEALDKLYRGVNVSVLAARDDMKELGVKQCLTCEVWFSDRDGCGVGSYRICKQCRKGP